MSKEKHFRTDHFLGTLKSRVLSGGAFTAGGQVARFVLSLGSTAILARLLVPEDFGLVAMVTTVTGFLSLFKDAGLSISSVQKQNITHAQVSNLFWANILICAVLAIVAAAMGPVLSWFYKENRLLSITLVLSLSFILVGLVTQHQALLNRQMRFKAIALIDVSSLLCGLIAGIILASLGWGYWALVWSQLTSGLVELLLTWKVSGWRPQFPSRHCGTRAMLRFGGALTAGNFSRRLAGRIDTLLLGRFYGADSVGFYSRGIALLMRPLEQFLAPFHQVVVPMLSRLQDDPLRYKRTFLQVFSIVTLASFTLSAVALALSRPLVTILLGPKWDDVIPIFSSFALAALYLPVVAPSEWLLTTLGRGRDFLILSIVRSVVAVASFVIGLPFGATGIALAYSCSGVLICTPIAFNIAGKSGPVRKHDLFSTYTRYLPYWAITLGSVYIANSYCYSYSELFQICFSSTVGLLCGIISILCLPTLRRDLFSIAGTIRSMVKKV